MRSSSVITLYDHIFGCQATCLAKFGTTEINQGRQQNGEGKMIIEATNYFARQGQAEAVLEQRRKATEIRLELGLEPGRILLKLEGSGPDVRWECSFASQEAYEADRAARAASPAFEAARKQMHTLLDRFERHVSVQDEG